MSHQISFELCTTELWVNNLTWNTNSPQLTPCFRETFMTLVPAIILLFAIISEYLSIKSAKFKKIKTIPWNNFNRVRISITLLLLLLKLFEFFSHIYHIIQNSQSRETRNLELQKDEVVIESYDVAETLVISTFLTPVIQAASYLILMKLYLDQRKAGLHTSGPVWFYLFSFLICDSFTFQSSVINLTSIDLEEIDQYVLPIVKLIHFPILFCLFVFECRGDTPVKEPDFTNTRPDSPELVASFFSSITFWWYNGFLLYGYRWRIKMDTLWKTNMRDRASKLVPAFCLKWAKAKCTKKKGTYHLTSGERQQFNSVGWVILRLFWAPLLFTAFLKFVQDSLQYVTPMILKQLVKFMKAKDEPAWHGTFFALLFLILPTIQSLVLANYFYYIQVIGLQVRTMLVGTVYRKSLSLSGSSRMQSTTGELVNLMAVDSQRFQDLLLYVNLFWSAPYQIVLAIYLLYNELGLSVFAGVICMALVLPTNGYLSNRYKMKQEKLMRTKDERVKQVNEVLSGIKVIKLYAWENSFISNLFGLRSKELEYLKRILKLDAFMNFIWSSCPFLVAMVTFAVYVSVDSANVLTAEKAFVSISLFNLLRFPITILSQLVTSFVLTLVSVRRLNRFLNSDELVKYVTRNEELEAISIEGGTLSWSQTSDEQLTQDTKENAVLKDIDLSVERNSFVAIVGQVASGKTSLISAIIGDMHRIAGRFNISKSLSVAYVPQQAWIQNMTLRDNILFGSAYSQEKYETVLSTCSLNSDLEQLPGGDLAEIGEKGINLSGGQKQRVSLARACYSNTDIVLLDDPLSALDSHVAKHVFEKVLSSTTGLLKNKTRVLATNSLFVLPFVDKVVVLDQGRIVESGSYEELMKIEKGYLSEIMRQHYAGTQHQKNESSLELDEQKTLEQILSKEDKMMKSAMPPKPQDGRLIEDEKVETGKVDFNVYSSYFKATSLLWLSGFCLSLFLAAVFNISTNLWLSQWSSDTEDPERANDTELRTTRLLVYAGLGGLQCLAVLTGALSLSMGAIRAAKRMHSNLLDGVMHSPMNFFDTTPMGRIVNRFAKDIDVVDTLIPQAFRGWMNCLLQVLSTLFVICFSFPTFLLIVVPLSFVYYLIQKVFIVTTRQLKRLESTTRSPIYSHFSETLSGISTIRAYNCVERFVSQSDTHVDVNQSCSYPNIIANRWLSIRLEFFGNLITACAALFSVYYKGYIGASVAGLTISFSLSITQTLSWFIRMTSELETNIVSVERILEYVSNKREDLWIKEKRPPGDWPEKGSIEVENYSSRYRDDTELVLKDLCLDIKSGEKLGIVGRTGSGKSSLSLSLFRILEPASGKIVIDGLNLTEYGLHDIRSKLTIIPQDPVLFSGTLRFNLDPLKLYTDMEIWRALEMSHLKPYVVGLKEKLDYKVSEFGENFSVGQRQLICLARAILRKSKILILDEATASVDLETDSIVQKTIRDIFSDCTIITIAHRLHTILDSDRILVLERGRVLELDKPRKLISDKDSAFTSLVRDAGIEENSILSLMKD